jgi:glycosyltransferase involved in cell wall biosynthesis
MRVVDIRVVLPYYRWQSLVLLAASLGSGYQAFIGKEYFDPTIKSCVPGRSYVRFLRNYFLLNRRFVFQTGMWVPALKADVAYSELNPRILSNWLLLLLRKILKKKSVLHGHAWPRGGKNKRSDRVRHLMRWLADTVIVYTEAEAEELKEKMPDKHIVAAPNALYSKSVMGAAPNQSEAKNFIYSGRLVTSKKPKILIEAFASVVDRLPADCNLIFVGDGPLRVALETYSRKLKLESRVVFKGQIYDFETLRELYGKSIASISPGYVGLSLIQSFAFGVPMIIAQDEPHCPEIEAAIEGVNSRMFVSDSRSSLSKALLDFVQDRDLWLGRRAAIASYCAERYSVETMVSRVVKAVREHQG